MSIQRNSPLSEIGNILAHILDLDHIIFVFKDLDNVPPEIVCQILRGFWQEISESITIQSKNCFLACLLVNNELNFPYASEYSNDWNLLIPINLEVPTEFSRDELLSWIQQDEDVERLFNFQNNDQIRTTFERIWQNSSDQNAQDSSNRKAQKLLEAIYQECKCKLMEDCTWREL